LSTPGNQCRWGIEGDDQCAKAQKTYEARGSFENDKASALWKKKISDIKGTIKER